MKNWFKTCIFEKKITRLAKYVYENGWENFCPYFCFYDLARTITNFDCLYSRQGSFDDEADDVDDRSPLHDMSTHSHHSHHSHHSCHSYNNAAAGHPAHPPPMPVGGTRRDSDLSDAFLSPEAYRATQAVEFIAEHLRNEDEYVQVRL